MTPPSRPDCFKGGEAPLPPLIKDIDMEGEIVIGWAKIAKEYQPRDLNEKEKAQADRAALEEKLAKKVSFKLGN